MGQDHKLFGFPGGSDGKEPACDVGDPGLIPRSEASLGEGNGYAVSLPGESRGQRSLAGYGPCTLLGCFWGSMNY